MHQDLLAEPDWDDVLTPDDHRGLTPLFWSHVLPYGEVKLNMTSRLPPQHELTRDVRLGMGYCNKSIMLGRGPAPGARGV
jgi:hypothetical protein